MTCIATVLSLPIPLWNEAQRITGIELKRGGAEWSIILMAVAFLGILFSAIMPVFYFALCRNYGTLRFSKRLRWLSLAAAIVFSLFLAAAPLIEFLRPYYTAGRGFMDWRATVSHISSMLGKASSVAYILLLVAFFLQPSQESASPNLPASRFLSTVTKVAMISWGPWLVFLVLRFALLPYSYHLIRDYASQGGATPPRLADMFMEPFRALVSQACLFAAPYIIFKSRSLTHAEMAAVEIPPGD